MASKITTKKPATKKPVAKKLATLGLTKPIALIVAIVGFVVILVLLTTTIHNSYSHKLKSISFSVNTGPVSPESQQTKTLTITANSCAITILHTATNKTESTPCQLQPNALKNIDVSLVKYGLVDKIASNADHNASLLGGKTYHISVTLQDGSTLGTDVGMKFNTDNAPFFEDVGLYAPAFEGLEFGVPMNLQ